MLKTTESIKGSVNIISSEHDGGKKLDGLGGIGAILRYKLNYWQKICIHSQFKVIIKIKNIVKNMVLNFCIKNLPFQFIDDRLMVKNHLLQITNFIDKWFIYPI